MNKKKVLVVHPTRYDAHSLVRTSVTNKFDIIWFHESTAPEEQIYGKNVGPLTVNIHPETILKQLRVLAEEHQIHGIMSAQDYPGNILTSIIAQERNLPAPSPVLVTGFQHKIYSRKLQQQYVPEVTPFFCSLDPNKLDQYYDIEQLSFPLFTKPVKANFSIFAHKVISAHDLRLVINSYQLPLAFTQQFDWYAQKVGIMAEGSACYIAEQLLDGIQVTLEGFVYDGQVTIVGIVDSIMHPGTICFERFVYPSMLPQAIQERMSQAATVLMKGAGYNNGFFNIEFMYNPNSDQIGIIEINPRMASQFADLYEKVDGSNTYHQLLAIATSSKPHVTIGMGDFKVAASCVLRIFNNKKVNGVPTEKDIDHVKQEFPEAEVFIKVQPGQLLSEIEQDGKSYAYALIHLGGRDRQDIDQKLVRCTELLPFTFFDVI